MRDPAAIVQGGVISSSMKFASRQRESNLLRTIFTHHPEFQSVYHPLFQSRAEGIDTHTIEGGDVIVLSKKALAIGCSERTSQAAIAEVAQNALSAGPVEHVYQIDLPAKRNFMHLDTVFTIIDENLIVAYTPAIESILRTVVYRKDGEDEQGKAIVKQEELKESFIQVLKKEIPYLEVIETGYGDPEYASKEQWYDGANVFALAPRRVISYNRNTHTNRALKDAGVEVHETSSSELSRGLGGPRCMTMPLERRRF
jgi:arginine deiminase